MRAGAMPADGEDRREYLAQKISGQEPSWVPPLLTKIVPGNIHGRPPRTQGDIVEDLNGGCVGERRAILNAIDDWRDEDGARRTQLTPGALYIARGMSLSREYFLHKFTALRQKAIEMSSCEVAEIHLDNAEIHLYSADWNPRCPQKRRGGSRAAKNAFTNLGWGAQADVCQKRWECGEARIGTRY